MTTAQEVGRYGEQVARAWMVERGWQVLASNWRCAEGEIDIVAADGGTLVIAEVKTRRSVSAGTPLEAVTPHKVWRLRRLAGVWLHSHHARWRDVRIDVVAVRVGANGRTDVEHVRGIE
ncbi:YraN family protein [Demequina flava]|uniref:YraN family protein n=1 Tax=Demequina flava TaxID=1095025 RepID=UPI0009E4A77F|nr:YraN family protein [Demequina flava]